MPDELLQNLSVDRRSAVWTQILGDLPPDHCVMVAEVEGRIVGFCHAGPARGESQPGLAEVYAIYLLADHQRRGIGAALLRHTVEALVKLGFARLLLWVAEENPSRRFYEALGGVPQGRKEDEFGGTMIREVSYHWSSLSSLLHTLAG
jgi:GNAT superfamily N-acetyltransferase